MNLLLMFGLFIIFVIMTVVMYRNFKNKINRFKPNEEYKSNDSSKVGELILFYAAWCPHSQTTLKLWYNYKEKYDKSYNVSFSEIDCDQNTQMADSYNIDSYPTIILLLDGKKYIYDAQMNNDNLTQFINTIMK